jgi:hypothetical protein
VVKMAFNTAKEIVYSDVATPEDVRGKEFILQLILASASLDQALITDKYMHTINQEIYGGLLFMELHTVGKMKRWAWAKKVREKNNKTTQLVDMYIDQFAPDVGTGTAQFKREYFTNLCERAKDKGYLRQMLLDLDADDEMFKKYKVDRDPSATKKKKAQKTLF